MAYNEVMRGPGVRGVFLAAVPLSAAQHGSGPRRWAVYEHEMQDPGDELPNAWEWADYQPYPERLSSLALWLGVNYIVYAMTD